MAERDPYLVIMRAAAEGKGVCLNAREVLELSNDDAIAQVAYNALTAAEYDRAQLLPSRSGWVGMRVHRPAGKG